MILIKIDALTTTELQYIAQQESMEDWESLSREELIEALEDLYDEQEFEGRTDRDAKVNRRRYCNSLTDFRGNEDLQLELPGVEGLPDVYAETTIHLLLRDPYWAYAFWSISPIEKARIEEAGKMKDLFLRVSMQRSDIGASDVEFFDITVGFDDTDWNINLPEMGSIYSVALCCLDAEGGVEELCASKSVQTPKCYWTDHLDELNADPALFKLYFSSLVTKDGVVVDNPTVQEIADSLSAGMRS
ncbi:MAG: DUF4912 domain-containing protein [Sphaerochaetaceae bacterium]|nr:DUF4912 domain-containing protein [Sphaerochaetaceae bacterium]